MHADPSPILSALGAPTLPWFQAPDAGLFVDCLHTSMWMQSYCMDIPAFKHQVSRMFVHKNT